MKNYFNLWVNIYGLNKYTLKNYITLSLLNQWWCQKKLKWKSLILNIPIKQPKEEIIELVAPCADTTMDIPARDCVILRSLVPEPNCNLRIKE